MKPLLYLLLATLCLAPVALHAQVNVSKLVAIEENGPRSKQLNYVYLSDGYTQAQLDAGLFAAEVQRAVDYLFTREPWTRYRRFCNIYRIEVPSNQSGTDGGENGGARDTYFQSGFSPTIDRLNILTATGEARAYSIMNAFVPEYDVPVVIVNDSTYGGSGGPIAVATTNYWGPRLVEHESGHSFAGLGDEYQTPTPGYTQFEWPNTTQQADILKVRWKIWVEPGTPSKTPEFDPLYMDKVGHFEGANYHDTGHFRAHDISIMGVMGSDNIGQVNRERFVTGMYTRLSLVNDFAPTALIQTHTEPTDVTFSVSPKSVSSGPPITVEWKLNGVTLPGETGNTLSRTNTQAFGNGSHTLKAIVRDPTDWVRTDTKPLVKEITWTLNLSKQQMRPPEIATPLPATYVLPVGTMIALDATVTAESEGPITYQWLKNNAPFKPDITDYRLPIAAMSVADAGTYSVKISNPLHTKVYSCVVSVVDPNVPRVVVGKTKTATLAFAASANIPAVSWRFQNASGPALANGADYANATTKALQVKNVDVGDSGNYFFSVGNYGPSPAVELLVVTGKTDYAGATLTLPVGKVGAYYNEPFPLPNDPLKTPNSFAGILPAGLKIDAKTGRITGVPTVASKQALGDEVTFTVGNEFGKIPVKITLLIRPLPAGGGGVFAGRILPGSDLGGPTGGLIEFTLLSTGSYSGNAMIGAEKIPFKNNVAVLNADAQSATGILTLKPKHAPGGVNVAFTLHDGGDQDPMTATISAVNSQFAAWRNKWLPPENVDTFKGYHTFAFTVPEGSNVTVPKGNGFGSVTIDANGKSVVAGKLADGESFTTSSLVSPGGSVLVYQSLYATATKGSLCAVLDLDPASEAGPISFGDDTDVSWLRPADTRPVSAGRLYRDGFLIQDIKADGGLYTPPVKPGILMALNAATGTPLVNASLSFAELLGGDPLAVNANVGLEIKTVALAKVTTLNPKVVTFTATPADGRFKGSYTTKDNDPRPPLAPNKPRPQISRKVDYQGIIINQDGTLIGLGYFLRDSLPKADNSDTPATSPKYSGDLKLERVDPGS